MGHNEASRACGEPGGSGAKLAAHAGGQGLLFYW